MHAPLLCAIRFLSIFGRGLLNCSLHAKCDCTLLSMCADITGSELGPHLNVRLNWIFLERKISLNVGNLARPEMWSTSTPRPSSIFSNQHVLGKERKVVLLDKSSHLHKRVCPSVVRTTACP